MFMLSLFRELYCDFIVVSAFCSHCLLLRSLTYLSNFLSYWYCWFTCIVFVYCVCVIRCYTISIFVTIYITLCGKNNKLKTHNNLYIYNIFMFPDSSKIVVFNKNFLFFYILFTKIFLIQTYFKSISEFIVFWEGER